VSGEGTGPGAGERHVNRRKRVLLIVLGVGLALVPASWGVGGLIKSPADAAAARRPPTPSLITVPVEKRTVTSDVVLRGTVQYGSAVPVLLSGAVGRAGPGDGEGGSSTEQLVTKAPALGTRLAEGSVLAEVSGRPILLLRGRVPMYRSIGPGMRGDDVRQLQRALKRLKLSPGSTSGVYDAATGEAVRRLYDRRGYQAQAPTFEQRKQLRELTRAVEAARAELDADGSSAEGATGTSTSGTATSGTATSGTATSGTATSGTSLSGASLSGTVQARRALRDAQEDLTDYRKGYGVSVPAGEVVFLPSLPARVSKVAVRPGDRVQSQLAEVTSGALVLAGTADPADVDLLRKGQSATIDVEGADVAKGRLTALGAAAKKVIGASGGAGDEGGPAGAEGSGQSPASADESADSGAAAPEGGDSGGSDSGTAFVITPADTAALTGSQGGSLRIAVRVGATKGSVLAVPVAAVSTGADGQSRLEVAVDGSRTRLVPVIVGLTALGYAQVSPVEPNAITVDDRVVVGTR
jgi:hypothetical protein